MAYLQLDDLTGMNDHSQSDFGDYDFDDYASEQISKLVSKCLSASRMNPLQAMTFTMGVQNAIAKGTRENWAFCESDEGVDEELTDQSVYQVLDKIAEGTKRAVTAFRTECYGKFDSNVLVGSSRELRESIVEYLVPKFYMGAASLFTIEITDKIEEELGESGERLAQRVHDSIDAMADEISCSNTARAFLHEAMENSMYGTREYFK